MKVIKLRVREGHRALRSKAADISIGYADVEQSFRPTSILELILASNISEKEPKSSLGRFQSNRCGSARRKFAWWRCASFDTHPKISILEFISPHYADTFQDHLLFSKLLSVLCWIGHHGWRVRLWNYPLQFGGTNPHKTCVAQLNRTNENRTCVAQTQSQIGSVVFITYTRSEDAWTRVFISFCLPPHIGDEAGATSTPEIPTSGVKLPVSIENRKSNVYSLRGMWTSVSHFWLFTFLSQDSTQTLELISFVVKSNVCSNFIFFF